jgi:hypothetical protein
VIRSKDQLRLNVRYYLVRLPGFPEMLIQAPTRAAARYGIFKRAREAGYFAHFRQFLARGCSVREVRR